jgi:hypothetical protein
LAGSRAVWNLIFFSQKSSSNFPNLKDTFLLIINFPQEKFLSEKTAAVARIGLSPIRKTENRPSWLICMPKAFYTVCQLPSVADRTAEQDA